MTYVLCVIAALIFRGSGMMAVALGMMASGVPNLGWTIAGFFVGLLLTPVYGFYAAVIFVPIYNYLQRREGRTSPEPGRPVEKPAQTRDEPIAAHR